MRVALVNLPYRRRLQRRFAASYFAPNFLLPPLELMSLGAVVRERKGGDAVLVDAVAERLDAAGVIARLRPRDPDLIVSLLGFNSFPEDVRSLRRIAGGLPRARVAAFGYLPSRFPVETIERGGLDYVLVNEPEDSLADLYDRLSGRGGGGPIPGVAAQGPDGVVQGPPRPRIRDLDALPFPDHGLVNLALYNESFAPRPMAAILSERGCPFSCTFCVRTYGPELVSRSAGSLRAEIDRLVQRHRVRHIRFMDDTFTLNRPRLVEVMEGLARDHPRTTFSALTRLDAVDAEALRLMKRAGCLRLYVGVESGSPRLLAEYRKGIDLHQMRRGAALCRAAGIETTGFFIVGGPTETEREVRESVAFARELDLDYIIVTKLQYWPGTELFSAERENIDFDLFAEDRLLYSPMSDHDFQRWERVFYREFYLRPSYLARRLSRFVAEPADAARGVLGLLAFVAGLGNRRDDLI